MGYSQTIANWELPGITLKRMASTGGGEYASPCPGCGGHDRFRVWPNKGSHGRFWCRQCRKSGDMIEFLRWQKGMSFKEACNIVGKPNHYNKGKGHESSSFQESKASVEVPRKTQKPRIRTDFSWLRPCPIQNEHLLTVKPIKNDGSNQEKIDERLPIDEKGPFCHTSESHNKKEILPSPQTFSKQCLNCANLETENEIAWCCDGHSYRNHKHLKACPVGVINEGGKITDRHSANEC